MRPPGAPEFTPTDAVHASHPGGLTAEERQAPVGLRKGEKSRDATRTVKPRTARPLSARSVRDVGAAIPSAGAHLCDLGRMGSEVLHTTAPGAA